jgi:hypothetical protein
MTHAATILTDNADSAAAGADLGAQLRSAFSDGPPDAVILFASPRYDFAALLGALHEVAAPRLLVGGSSAGEFTNATFGTGLACGVALRAPEMRFAASVGRALTTSRADAVASIAAGFTGLRNVEFTHRTALVLTDALAGEPEDLIDRLTVATGGTYQFCGGGVGGDERFERRFVFFGREAVADAAVALEILSNKPIGIGVAHGWTPASDAYRVTDAVGTQLLAMNAEPAADVYEEHARATDQRFDPTDPLPFFLHNIIGVKDGDRHKLRVPLAVKPDRSIACATEVPRGAAVSIMRTSTSSAAAAAATAVRSAIGQLGSHKPRAALFFDCVATRLRMGAEFGCEIDAVKEALGPAKLAGCNSLGQIARAEGQFNGFHNCTAVVCVLPE